MASAIELQGLAVFSVAVFWRGVAFLEEPQCCFIINLIIYLLFVYYFFLLYS